MAHDGTICSRGSQDILNGKYLNRISMVSSADDLAAAVTARKGTELQMKIDDAIDIIIN